MKQLGLLLIILGAALFMWRSVEKSQEEDARIAQVVERHQAQKAQAAQVSLPESAVDAADPSDASDKPWRYEGRYGKKRIKDIRLGDRVIARNPEVSESERMDFVDPDSSWKQVTLSMIKPDQTKVIVSLLRPQAWMARQDARIGGKIHLVLEELGLDGEADVLAIDDAPEIKKGKGQVVTGTFHHQAGNVLDIAVQGLEDPIGTTSNHPFWSEDRQAFVQAGDLKVGEQLRQVDGSLTLVSSITNRGPPEQVFNLEVAGEHVYFVSDAGVLVHNSYTGNVRNLLVNGKVPGNTKSNAFGKWFDSLTPDELDALWNSSIVFGKGKKKRTIRKIIEDRIRHPGGLHEWLMAGRANKIKRWGASMDDIKKMRTLTSDVKLKRPSNLPGHIAPGKMEGVHGGDLSGRFHYELRFLIDASRDMNDYSQRMKRFAKRWLPNGVDDLPIGMIPR